MRVTYTMPKKARELGALEVKRLRERGVPGHYAVGGVAGLAMQIAPTGATTWILRLKVGDRRRDMGLGGYPDVELARAREKAREARELVEQGVDPILQRQQARSALSAKQAAQKTFRYCALKFIESKSAEWKNDKHAAQWTSTLTTYAFPQLGHLLVSDVGVPQVLEVLRPIWTTKTETATRLRGRIESVLDWAAVHHYREGLNPARWKGHLDKILPTPTKVATVKHRKALPIDDVPAFMVKLRAIEGNGARALEFAILTAARSGEVRGATWHEIKDGKEGGAEWVIPKERMKAGKEHKVPLSPAALELLRALPRREGCDLVFPSTKQTPLSDMTLLAVLRRMGVDAVPHGFRSTFKDWASERTVYPNEMSEMALAHAIGNKVEEAYRRGDMVLKRRMMMDDWGCFCGSTVEQSKSE
jgi:integrase